jgi:hypothetical protein
MSAVYCAPCRYGRHTFPGTIVAQAYGKIPIPITMVSLGHIYKDEILWRFDPENRLWTVNNTGHISAYGSRFVDAPDTPFTSVDLYLLQIVKALKHMAQMLVNGSGRKPMPVTGFDALPRPLGLVRDIIHSTECDIIINCFYMLICNYMNYRAFEAVRLRNIFDRFMLNPIINRKHYPEIDDDMFIRLTPSSYSVSYIDDRS